MCRHKKTSKAAVFDVRACVRVRLGARPQIVCVCVCVCKFRLIFVNKSMLTADITLLPTGAFSLQI